MSYYILPSKQIDIKFDKNELPINTCIEQEPFISNSVHYYINEIQTEFNNCHLEQLSIDLLYKQYEPYEYLLNKDFIISEKNDITYYIFIELFKISTIFSSRELNHKLTIYSDCHHYNIFKAITHVNKNNKFQLNSSFTEKIDIFTFLQTNINNLQKYTLDLLKIITYILSYHSENGSCIIKIGDIIYKPIIDIIYLLSILYEKVYIIKPLTSSVFSNERFVICKNFSIESLKKESLYQYLNEMIHDIEQSSIFYPNMSILSNDIPYFFINKIEESNLSIAHQQLEYHDVLINIIFNKLCKDKLENIKKNHINKCIVWCDKYKVPYNKIMDKNIFLQDCCI